MVGHRIAWTLCDGPQAHLAAVRRRQPAPQQAALRRERGAGKRGAAAGERLDAAHKVLCGERGDVTAGAGCGDPQQVGRRAKARAEHGEHGTACRRACQRRHRSDARQQFDIEDVPRGVVDAAACGVALVRVATVLRNLVQRQVVEAARLCARREPEAAHARRSAVMGSGGAHPIRGCSDGHAIPTHSATCPAAHHHTTRSHCAAPRLPSAQRVELAAEVVLIGVRESARRVVVPLLTADRLQPTSRGLAILLAALADGGDAGATEEATDDRRVAAQQIAAQPAVDAIAQHAEDAALLQHWRENPVEAWRPSQVEPHEARVVEAADVPAARGAPVDEDAQRQVGEDPCRRVVVRIGRWQEVGLDDAVEAIGRRGEGLHDALCAGVADEDRGRREGGAQAVAEMGALRATRQQPSDLALVTPTTVLQAGKPSAHGALRRLTWFR
eukprot:6202835-Prymnesium_polylepis.2